MSYILEVIAFNIASCKAIESCGAHRIELCDNPGEGGTTPSAGMIRMARKSTSIQLFPIIRPRGGDFLYSDEEFHIMKQDIQLCKDMGCDGVVLGMLLPNGQVDTERTSHLVETAYPMDVTFHRAFDRTPNPVTALEDVIITGCTRLLTSGQQKTAAEATTLIRELILQADDRISIMPGSGIRADNIRMIMEQTNATEFHTSVRMIQPGQMLYQHPVLSNDSGITTVDEEELKRIICQLTDQTS